ncbi:MAG: AHH domain-containing protein [Novosphingobium sp.]
MNDPSRPGHDPALQRHHLLPRQLLTLRAFDRLFDTVGHDHLGLDDFRRNGLLLPARDEAAVRTGLPLHRGPHRRYNEVVIARVGQIEAGWAALSSTNPSAARLSAQARLALLQRALRRRLLAARFGACRLSGRVPLGKMPDYSELDAMAASLWPDLEP